MPGEPSHAIRHVMVRPAPTASDYMSGWNGACRISVHAPSGIWLCALLKRYVIMRLAETA